MRILSLILIYFLTISPVLASMTIDNADDSLSCGTTDNWKDNAAWTACGWINPTIDVIGGGDPVIMTKGNVSVKLAATKKIYVIVATTGTNATHFSVDNTITFNTWQFFCATSDGSGTGANYKIYINGVEVSYSSSAGSGTTVDNAGDTFIIGNSATPNGTRPFGGQETNIAIWDGTALSSGNILSLYKGGKWGYLSISSNPTRFYPMIEKSNSTAANGLTANDLMGGTACTADDGTNNTGMTWQYENFLQKSDPFQVF